MIENYPNTPILPDDIKELTGQDLLKLPNVGVGEVDILDDLTTVFCHSQWLIDLIVQGGNPLKKVLVKLKIILMVKK